MDELHKLFAGTVLGNILIALGAYVALMNLSKQLDDSFPKRWKALIGNISRFASSFSDLIANRENSKYIFIMISIFIIISMFAAMYITGRIDYILLILLGVCFLLISYTFVYMWESLARFAPWTVLLSSAIGHCMFSILLINSMLFFLVAYNSLGILSDTADIPMSVIFKFATIENEAWAIADLYDSKLESLESLARNRALISLPLVEGVTCDKNVGEILNDTSKEISDYYERKFNSGIKFIFSSNEKFLCSKIGDSNNYNVVMHVSGLQGGYGVSGGAFVKTTPRAFCIYVDAYPAALM